MVSLLKLVVLFVLMAEACGAWGQADGPDAVSRFQLRVAVDEVVLTFHAADANGLAVNDLKLGEMKLRDNGRPPSKVLAFQAMTDFPIRAGILMDTSGSMQGRLAANRAIAMQYAQRVLRAKTDQAFVMDFGYGSGLVQDWTGDPARLVAGIRGVSAGQRSAVAGTALYDTIFHACYSLFGKVDNAASGNFILLFSDGEDNASHVDLETAVSACQKTNTAIYVFRAPSEDGNRGAPVLTEMAAVTGGRVFFGGATEAEVYDDLRMIEAELRNEYRLVYRPAALKRDGAFHTVELTGPERAPLITVRSGYFAPVR